MSRSANLSLCRSVALSPLRIVKVSNRAQLRRRYANKNQITQGQKTSSPNGRMMPTHLTNQGINQPDVDETGYYEFPPIGPCVREARAGLPVLGVLRFPQRGTKSALLYIVHNRYMVCCHLSSICDGTVAVWGALYPLVVSLAHCTFIIVELSLIHI